MVSRQHLKSKDISRNSVKSVPSRIMRSLTWKNGNKAPNPPAPSKVAISHMRLVLLISMRVRVQKVPVTFISPLPQGPAMRMDHDLHPNDQPAKSTRSLPSKCLEARPSRQDQWPSLQKQLVEVRSRLRPERPSTAVTKAVITSSQPNLVELLSLRVKDHFLDNLNRR
jgi:hypothetical protein